VTDTTTGSPKESEQIRFRGVSHNISDVLRETDWFLLPSTNEPCSVAITEAMALGLPVLASASGGNIDLIRSGETGLLFEPNNPADLAAKLRLLLNNQCAVISPEQIRESARHRSASAVAADYRKIYEYLAARS